MEVTVTAGIGHIKQAIRTCTHKSQSTRQLALLPRHRSSPWAYQTGSMPLPLPPSYAFPNHPQQPCDTNIRLSVGLSSWHSSTLYTEPHLSPFAVSAVRTQQPCDDNIRCRSRYNQPMVNILALFLASPDASGVHISSSLPIQMLLRGTASILPRTKNNSNDSPPIEGKR